MATTVPEDVPGNAPAPQADADAERLAQLGYKQELSRSWSGFSNFAISFSIISILSGCFTTFYQAWNNGGPIAITWGWPVIAGFILIIGFCMSELVSAYPTAGGIYWWAAKLGKPVHGWYTGWLNLVGLIAVTASVDYGCASFTSILVGMYDSSWDTGDLHATFYIFLGILALHALINIFGHHLIALLQNVSVYWHVFGVLVVVAILLFGPDSHQSASFVFTERINNSGFGESWFWFFILPMGFLLTQYTITGFDACAHVSEETKGASVSAAKGLWKSIFYSAIGGWILLLAFLFAATDVEAINGGGGAINVLLTTALSSALAKTVILISVVGQFLCGMSCVTSLSRMGYAFSRDGGVPGSKLWSKVDANRTPVNAVLGGTVAAAVLTLPALYKSPNGQPTAFLAVTSVAVIGLYLAFLIPIWLRLRQGESFQVGPWNLGPKYKWMCWVAVSEIAVISVYFVLPFSPAGIPGKDEFDWTAVNYSPIALGTVLIGITLWWFLSARTWFTGPRRTVDEAPEKAAAAAD
ncbi:amino acid permease [Yinghuangia seranimata]|uniref:amino acid permease n=1 Tax=Yinghuangia seranimata TaxID=408067 RepID=UPI00248D0734|nr:amino acid permease [Yinghuangia seranimata]MDI2125828.1 amino acid permease [Yinghuangia seranimata]